MKLKWRPTNDVEAEILGSEHNDAEDLHDVVANVCDGSTLGAGHIAANELVYRYNSFEVLVAAVEYCIPFLPSVYPFFTLKKRLEGALAEVKKEKQRARAD